MIFVVYYVVSKPKCHNIGHQNNLIDRTIKIKGRQNYGFTVPASQPISTLTAGYNKYTKSSRVE